MGFHSVNMHILTETPLQGSLSYDREVIYQALAAGNSWVGCDYYHNSQGFRFMLESSQGKWGMGAKVAYRENMALHVKTPRHAQVSIIRNGKPWASSQGHKHRFAVTRPGAVSYTHLPAQLAGRTGKIKIVCEVENLTGESQMLEFKDPEGQPITKEMMVYTPYAVSVSGVQLDNDKFANIQAPGVPEVSPEGVLTNVQGVTSVSWTVPLIPPAYPAKQYIVLEADGRNIELPSFNIGVMPVLPTTSSIDNLTGSLTQLYDGFDQIAKGIGASNKDATLLYGLSAVKMCIRDRNHSERSGKSLPDIERS